MAVRESIADVLRDELATRLGLYWYGQQEADWIAHLETYRRLEIVHFRHSETWRLNLFATIAKSCGWWWPRAGQCVISERPLAIRTENGDERDQIRLHHESGPAIVYSDGWALYSWHGTRVPSWVIEDPTAARITDESNFEFRRCAIEHLGWVEFVEQAGLALIGTAPDPADADGELRLYELPYQKWGKKTRLLLNVNGSPEYDGTTKPHGMRVPPWFTNPVDAADWAYGLNRPQLKRRTG